MLRVTFSSKKKSGGVSQRDTGGGADVVDADAEFLNDDTRVLTRFHHARDIS